MSTRKIQNNYYAGYRVMRLTWMLQEDGFLPTETVSLAQPLAGSSAALHKGCIDFKCQVQASHSTHTETTTQKYTLGKCFPSTFNLGVCMHSFTSSVWVKGQTEPCSQFMMGILGRLGWTQLGTTCIMWVSKTRGWSPSIRWTQVAACAHNPSPEEEGVERSGVQSQPQASLKLKRSLCQKKKKKEKKRKGEKKRKRKQQTTNQRSNKTNRKKIPESLQTPRGGV